MRDDLERALVFRDRDLPSPSIDPLAFVAFFLPRIARASPQVVQADSGPRLSM